MARNVFEDRHVDRGFSPVLELTVNNHPGVMSHVCGLFARRAYNVGKILCLPTGDGVQSRIWLTIDHGGKLDQIVKQAMKLEDVLDVRTVGREDEVFGPIEALVSGDGGTLRKAV